MNAISSYPRFSGSTRRRIKQYKKEQAFLARQMEKQQTAANKPKKPGRKERIMAFRAEQNRIRQENQKRYQEALNRFLTDSKPFVDLVQKPLFEDRQGTFTGHDLLKALKEEMKSDKIGFGIFCAFATATVVIPALVYAINFIHHGHENIYYNPGILEAPFVRKFPAQVQSKVRDLLRQFENNSLIETTTNNDGERRIRLITPLGKRLMEMTPQ